jgi:hypothetical protein
LKNWLLLARNADILGRAVLVMPDASNEYHCPSIMPQSLFPILSVAMEETYRVAITVWGFPWMMESIDGWVRLIAILNGW